jgi:hypothetical protein
MRALMNFMHRDGWSRSLTFPAQMALNQVEIEVSLQPFKIFPPQKCCRIHFLTFRDCKRNI